jgi:Rrf2 family protein
LFLAENPIKSLDNVVLPGHAMISQKARYALRALMALAREDAMMIAEIAEQERIPRKFLEQILLDLKRHGIVASRRGRLGGYALLARPNQITFGRILRIIDGPIAPLPCLSRIAYRRCPDCKNEASCEIRRVFAGVAESAREVLDRTTIAEAIDGDRTKPSRASLKKVPARKGA